MTKFKVFKNNQKYMTRLGIYPIHLTEPTNEFFKSIISYYSIVSMTLAFTASVVYILKNPSEVKPSLGAMKIAFASAQCAGMFLGIGLRMIKVKDLHFKLQKIVDEAEDENSEVHNIYWECEQKCRKHSQILSYFVIFHTSVFTIVMVYALICIAFGHYDTSSWYLPFFLVVPFDRTRIFGWFMTWLFQLNMAFCYASCMTSITSYFVSCCYYINAMSDHFNVMINSITKDVERMKTEKNPRKVNKIRQKIGAQLCSLIKFHIRVFEIFQMLADISSGPIFALLPGNVILMSVCMYDIEVSVTNVEPVVLLFDISCILCALFWPSFICYYATHVTNLITTIGDMVYDSNWPEYPPELQKYIILTISRSQQPVYFTGFGLIRCTLEIFGKLCKTSSSYYIMFRAIDRR